MVSGFGKGYEFEMKRLKLDRGEYLIYKLEAFEKRRDQEEERFEELHDFLGQQYCHGLEPSVVGFKRCVSHLLL